MPKRLLYVGAGHDRSTPFPALFDGYEVIRLDFDPSTEPDIQFDARALGLITPGAFQVDNVVFDPFDGVALAHTLEHFTEKEGAEVLAGCRHVLAAGGRIAVSVPNLAMACKVAADTDPDTIVYYTAAGKPIRPADMLYGWQFAISHAEGHPLMCHKWGYNARTLEAALRSAGFAEVIVTADAERGATEIHGYARKP